jgi:hypothetical protein
VNLPFFCNSRLRRLNTKDHLRCLPNCESPIQWNRSHTQFSFPSRCGALPKLYGPIRMHRSHIRLCQLVTPCDAFRAGGRSLLATGLEQLLCGIGLCGVVSMVLGNVRTLVLGNFRTLVMLLLIVTVSSLFAASRLVAHILCHLIHPLIYFMPVLTSIAREVAAALHESHLRASCTCISAVHQAHLRASCAFWWWCPGLYHE